jgi:hypothetical protein
MDEEFFSSLSAGFFIFTKGRTQMRRNNPKPICYTRALKVLAMREDPVLHLLRAAGHHYPFVRRFKKRASVRIVADLFGVTPAQVAEDLYDLKGAKFPSFDGFPDPKPLWASGRGAW